jgi:hypothetical protein
VSHAPGGSASAGRMHAYGLVPARMQIVSDHPQDQPTCAQLDFVHSRRRAQRLGQARTEGPRAVSDLDVGLRRGNMAWTSPTSAHPGHRLGKSRRRLALPGRRTHRHGGRAEQTSRHPGHHRVPGPHGWCRLRRRVITPGPAGPQASRRTPRSLGPASRGRRRARWSTR